MAPPVRRERRGGGSIRSEEAALVLAGRAWLGGRLQPVEIAIGTDGTIRSVGKVRTGAERHDVGERVILPAATDLHVHLRDGSASAGGESVASGTVEAAVGGVTLVGEMPNSELPITTPERLREKADHVRGRAAVDVLLYALPTSPNSVGRLALRAGAFKLFLAPTTGVDATPSREQLPPLFDRIARSGLPLTVHAEDPSRFRELGPLEGPRGWNLHRPPEAEEAAVDLLTTAPPSLRLHVAHVTTPRAVSTLRAAGVSFETTPHHLLLSDRAGADARFKVNPPLRAEEERRGLWEAFSRGEVPCLASDHAPHSVEAKSLPFDRAPSGIPGLATMLPLLLAKVREGKLPLAVLLQTACDRPARWFGQPLGRIAPGHRANLLVVDFRARSRLSTRELAAPCGWTAFEGWEVVRPVEHWRDGERIVDSGEYVGRPHGRVVRPEFAPGLDRPEA